MKEFRFSASVAMLTVTALLTACATTGDASDKTEEDAKEIAAVKPVSDPLAYQKIGKPYEVKGKWYTPKAVDSYSKTGQASWYGPRFNGGSTASGETYDMNHLSAAHKTLPLPSYVRVTNLDNDSSVIVRVNDRGPFVSGRIIDLSKKAAEMLDMTGAGVANVRVDYVGPAPQKANDMDYLLASYEKDTPAVPDGVDPGRFGEGAIQVASAAPAEKPVQATETAAPVEVAATEVKVPIPVKAPGGMTTATETIEVASAEIKTELPVASDVPLAMVESRNAAENSAAIKAANAIIASNDSLFPTNAPIPLKR
ncbi:MAG: septal ring lytic transglycosylase RlpA family protein [Puniceicoccales bacterium]